MRLKRDADAEKQNAKRNIVNAIILKFLVEYFVNVRAVKMVNATIEMVL